MGSNGRQGRSQRGGKGRVEGTRGDHALPLYRKVRIFVGLVRFIHTIIRRVGGH